MLATLLRPDEGRASVFGHDVVEQPAEVRARISLTGQYASVDETLTGRENLTLLGRLHGLSRSGTAARTAELLAGFDLAEDGDRLVRTYSGGMRRRLDLAAGLVVPPGLLFLDEPTTGLDPRSRGEVWRLVRSLVADGATVLLTTQYLDEADQLADRIAVIDHGRLVAEGTNSELKASVGGGTLHVRLHDPVDRDAARDALARALGAVVPADADPAVLTARVDAAGDAAAALAELSWAGIEIAEFALGQPTLDEVFLALTGNTTAPKEPVA
jgi:ABC-2 type transport system ATP-binding protein